MAKVYEMLWDCKFCGQPKLLAKTHRTCTQCGAAQDPSWRYFPSDADKVAVQHHTFKGKDQLCPACDSVNPAGNNFCIRCGAPMEGAETAQTVPSRSKGEGENFETQNLKALQQAQKELEQRREQAQRKRMGLQRSGPTVHVQRFIRQPVNRKTLAIAGVGLGSMIGLASLPIWLLSLSTPITVEVTGHTWQRNIAIESYQSRSGSDWDDSLPSGAYNVSCSRKQRSTNRIADGETCSTRQVDQGDGTFREESYCTTDYREEPVYGDYCTYRTNAWEHSRWVTARGNGLADTPRWPTVNAQTCASTRLGCERPGRRKETYRLQLRDPESGEVYQCDRNQTEWQTTPASTQFQLKIGRFLGGARCKTLERLS
ncbi:MAG: zinc ribbon domain-containing protein [Cyanobacteria bacterium J06627_15]